MMKYEIKQSSQFKRELKLLKKRNYDIKKLYKVVAILANGRLLPEKYLDHELKGNHKGFRECHITNDWLLVYRYYDESLILFLSRTGTHSDLF